MVGADIGAFKYIIHTIHFDTESQKEHRYNYMSWGEMKVNIEYYKPRLFPLIISAYEC